MKILALSTLLALSLTADASEPAIPAAFAADRYEKLLENSPFSLATPTAPVVAPEAVVGFAEGWFIGGVARLAGKDFVTVKSRDQSIQFSLFGQEENREHGVTLERIEWSADIGKSKVTIRKGNELANLEFNEAEMKTPAAPVQPVALRGGSVPQVPRPVIAPNAGGLAAPAVNQPGGVRQRLRVAPNQPNGLGIPLPGTQPNASGVNGAGPNAGTPAAGAGRRRIRVINGGQNVNQ